MYYSTSWANDGVQWSAPAPLNDDPSNPYWTPTASIGPDGHIYLWAPRTSDLAIERLDLGAGGANISDRSAVTGMSGYENPDIRYRPALGLYQMLADRGTGIDYFSSSDGLSFTLARPMPSPTMDRRWRCGRPPRIRTRMRGSTSPLHRVRTDRAIRSTGAAGIDISLRRAMAAEATLGAGITVTPTASERSRVRAEHTVPTAIAW